MKRKNQKRPTTAENKVVQPRHQIRHISHPIIRVVTQTYGFWEVGKTLFISFISLPNEK